MSKKYIENEEGNSDDVALQHYEDVDRQTAEVVDDGVPNNVNVPDESVYEGKTLSLGITFLLCAGKVGNLAILQFTKELRLF